jgi:hypothetical protein
MDFVSALSTTGCAVSVPAQVIDIFRPLAVSPHKMVPQIHPICAL